MTAEERASASLLREATSSGMSKPLSQQRPVWAADQPITRAEAMRQRAEFWDTAPAYEGHLEVWHALRAACEAEELELAQAIIDGAGVKLPTGSLEIAYDERGVRYTIPPVCLSMPINLVEVVFGVDARASVSSIVSTSPTKPQVGEALPVKVRLSTCQDMVIQSKLHTRADEIKSRVAEEAKLSKDALRVMFCGKVVSDDDCLGDIGFTKKDILQVFVFKNLPS
jgi:hypothetical protein